MAAVLFTRVLAIHGCPESIHSDKGTEFTNKMVAELAQLMGVKRSFTAGYNPRANGLAERFVGRMSEIMQRHKALGGICEWPELLPFAVFAHNISPVESSSYSPFHLMYGRQPVWPEAPIIMEKYPFYTQDIDTYLQLYLEYYHEIVRDAHLNLEKSRDRMKETFDRKREVFKNDKFHVGDLVYLMKPRLAVKRSKDKLLPKVYGPYVIDKIFDTTANLLDFKDRLIGKFPLDRLIKIPKSLRTPCLELKDKSATKSNLISTKFHVRLNLNNHCLKTLYDDFVHIYTELFTVKGPGMHLQGLRPPTDGLTVDYEIETQLQAEADKFGQEMAKATREARSIADRLKIEANNKMKAAIAIENELKSTLPSATIFGGEKKRAERAKVVLTNKNTDFYQFIVINNKISEPKSIVRNDEYEFIDDLYLILLEMSHNIEIGIFLNLKEAKALREEAGTIYRESVAIIRNTDLQREKLKASLETPKSSKQSTSNEISITKVVSGVATKRPNEVEVITIDEPPTKVRKQSDELDPEGYKDRLGIMYECTATVGEHSKCEEVLFKNLHFSFGESEIGDMAVKSIWAGIFALIIEFGSKQTPDERNEKLTEFLKADNTMDQMFTLAFANVDHWNVNHRISEDSLKGVALKLFSGKNLLFEKILMNKSFLKQIRIHKLKNWSKFPLRLMFRANRLFLCMKTFIYRLFLPYDSNVIGMRFAFFIKRLKREFSRTIKYKRFPHLACVLRKETCQILQEDDVMHIQLPPSLNRIDKTLRESITGLFKYVIKDIKTRVRQSCTVILFFYFDRKLTAFSKNPQKTNFGSGRGQFNKVNKQIIKFKMIRERFLSYQNFYIQFRYYIFELCDSINNFINSSPFCQRVFIENMFYDKYNSKYKLIQTIESSLFSSTYIIHFALNYIEFSFSSVDSVLSFCSEIHNAYNLDFSLQIIFDTNSTTFPNNSDFALRII